METLSKRILDEVATRPKATPVYAKALLHLGKRAAVDQALSRLARRGQLLRVDRGLYLRPIETRFGTRAPSVGRVLEALETEAGETIAPSGASAANKLGLTTQVPVRMIYLTSGRSRRLQFGGANGRIRACAAVATDIAWATSRQRNPSVCLVGARTSGGAHEKAEPHAKVANSSDAL